MKDSFSYFVVVFDNYVDMYVTFFDTMQYAVSPRYRKLTLFGVLKEGKLVLKIQTEVSTLVYFHKSAEIV